MSDRPLTAAELNAMFEATDNAHYAREDAELRREQQSSADEAGRACICDGGPVHQLHCDAED